MREVALIIHFLGLAMGMGTSFAFMFVGIAASKMEKEEGIQFMLKCSILGKMGHIGLVVLLLSGGYLLSPYMSNILDFPLLILKLVLFIALGGLVGIMSSKTKKAQLGDAEMHLKAIGNLGKISMPVGIAIIILAVLTFH